MNTLKKGGQWSWLMTLICISLLGFGCTQDTHTCPTPVRVSLSEADEYRKNGQLPFQFPLHDYSLYTAVYPPNAKFAAHGITTRGPENHAAEDVIKPAGTPVYAIANGRVSYSGRMDGYGWLVIVDHPQANLYSLYGHLSPSRWEISSGTDVVKGQLLGYLGDDFENGGSAEQPLRTHLHFGVRVGQRRDYSGMGEWRWMAGWIAPCPQDLGWLQPSVVITSQDPDIGRDFAPTAGLLERWGMEMLFSGIYLLGGTSVLVFGSRQKKPLLILLAGLILLAAGVVFNSKNLLISVTALGMGVLVLGVGSVLWAKRKRNMGMPHKNESR